MIELNAIPIELLAPLLNVENAPVVVFEEHQQRFVINLRGQLKHSAVAEADEEGLPIEQSQLRPDRLLEVDDDVLGFGPRNRLLGADGEAEGRVRGAIDNVLDPTA